MDRPLEDPAAAQAQCLLHAVRGWRWRRRVGHDGPAARPGEHTLYNGSSGTFLPVKEGNEAMATVTFDEATRIYPGNPVPSVDKLNIEIEDGEFLVFVGPSGCGKSTSLRMLAGLEEVNGGRILIGDRDVTNLSPKDRDVAMVFQNYALYPHMTVADNMGFALKIAGVDKGEIRKRVEEAAKILDLTPYLDRKPKALSGGQRQRVAMGRAIVRSPQVFLMDEPLSEPRRQAARSDAHADRLAPASPRRHHRLRDPRPGRGHDDG